jgi:ribonuclease HII
MGAAVTQNVVPSLAFDAHYGANVCGIDEAGRGPWAGPVVAAAVVWPQDAPIPQGLNDSKKLSAKKREALYDAILASGAAWGVGQASVEEIDQLNILRATLLAMQRAFAALPLQPDCALIDGTHCPALPCSAHAIIKGDAQSVSIAAASIIAKVTRDRLMRQHAATYPAYGFDAHAGYGTKQHQEALAQYGITPLHRRSFAPIARLG